MARLTKEEVKELQEKLHHWGTSRPLALRDTLDTIDALESELAEAKAELGRVYESNSKNARLYWDAEDKLKEARASTAAMLEKAATVKIYDAEIPKHWSNAIRALSTADKSAALREHVERNTKPLFDEINRLQNEYISLERRFSESQAALADRIKEARREEAEWFQQSIDDFEHASLETKFRIVNERVQRLAALQPAEEGGEGKATGG